MVKSYRNHSKAFRRPKRPYEKERLNYELKIIGKYGLKNKRELWTAQLALSKLRSAARQLLTLEEDDTKRVFEGEALLRRLTRMGLLKEGERSLDHVLGMTVETILGRRLQTLAFLQASGVSIHHTRVLIKQGHIRVGLQTCNVPSFLVRKDAEKHINFAFKSVFNGGKPGRVAKKKLRQGNRAQEDDDDE